MQTCEDFVRLVDNGQIEWGRGSKGRRTSITASEFATDYEYSWRKEGGRSFANTDVEQIEQFCLPLADQRFRDDEQNSLRALRTALRDHESSFDRFAQANLIRENATALSETS
jgi:hypothetical protein